MYNNTVLYLENFEKCQLIYLWEHDVFKITHKLVMILVKSILNQINHRKIQTEIKAIQPILSINKLIHK